MESTWKLCNLFKIVTDMNPSHLLIIGDFNYKEINWSGCYSTVTAGVGHHSHKFLETILDCYLIQHIKEPTRYRIDNSPNIFDLLFSDEIGMISYLIYLPGIGHSDHICLRFSVEFYVYHGVPSAPCKTKFESRRLPRIKTKY